MKNTNKEVRTMDFGTVVTVSWKGLKTGIFVGSKGGMSFVVADLDGQGVRCRRVFSTTLHTADGVIGVDKDLEKGFKSWCKDHGREFNIKLIKPVNKGSSLTKTKTVELETPKAKKSAKVAKVAKVAKAEPKAEPKEDSKLATVAEALAKGGMKPSDVAKVLKALM